MRLVLRRLLNLPVMAFLALAIVVATLVLALWPRQQITQANFDKIQVGMSRAELRELLGAPEYEVVEFGLVEGPVTYVINFDQSKEQGFRRGFRYYQRQQWTSSEISITVISDTEGKVVCQYSSEGRRWDWRVFLRSLVFW